MGIEKTEFGFGFNPKACYDCQGKCCVGESGFIWVNSSEIEDIANFLKISKKELTEKYLYKSGRHFSIQEQPSSFGLACVFFDSDNLNCKIYSVRPNQCRSFPFWDYFKKHIDELERECPGVYRL